MVRRVSAYGGCAALAALAFAGCGGGERQDANEPNGTFPVEVVKAEFPTDQHIADQSVMKITVRNSGREAIPNLAVTVQPFNYSSKQEGLADPTRPIWVVDRGPVGGDTAYVATWALGKVPPGVTKTFEWKVTPLIPGLHTVKWSVAAGLNGKAKASVSGGGQPHGSFTVNVSGKPADAIVDPDTGQVIRNPSSSQGG